MGQETNSDELPHPEGEIYDPVRYRELLAHHNSSSKIVGWLGIGSFIGLFSSCISMMRPDSEITSGLAGAMFLMIFLGNIFYAATRSSRYQSLLRTHQLAVAEAKRKSNVTNNVSINVGSGSTWTGPVVVGDNINFAHGASAKATSSDMRGALDSLVTVSTKLIERLPDDRAKLKVSSALKEVTELATKPKPDKRAVEISAKGIVEAANTVADIASPVAKAVKAVLALLSVAS